MEIKECPKTKEELVDEYNNLDTETRKILECSYSTVADTDASADRLEELRMFCKKLGMKRVGVAFCKGLRSFGENVDAQLSKDFETYSVCCNVCGIDKPDINIKQVKDDRVEPACNPLGQAAVLNDKQVDIVVKCGFCMGHDIIFSKNIKAPTTTLIVKDRKHKHRTADIF
ncbi:MAG: DUF1847 domain-containing protein [Candidatus Woesearchaeota archaeon]